MQEQAPYIRPLRAGDRDEWLRLRRALWPGRAAAQLAAELPGFESGSQPSGLPCAVFVVDRGDGRLGGFVEAALRAFAEGCESAPVGYVEGWYVEPDLRRAGVGGLLVEAAEHWSRSQGCREMGSDCHAYNPIACQAHLSLGYRHTDRTLGFWKPIEDGTPAEAPTGDRCGDADDETKDWVGLTTCDLPVAAAVRCVSQPSAGGIDVFLGTTRTERSPSGQVLVALDYEAYAEMACGQLRDLARRARERWPVVRLVLLHRIGRVPLGEPSVLVAVSTPHRGEAFEACRWLIDALKAEVAVWKKEVWADGSESWVHPVK
jgi:molybdopterin synthase catalytic subunit